MMRLVANLVPPLLVALVLLGVWQLACSGPGATLPPPSAIWAEASELIVNPFFDYGQGDVGLAWRILSSLQRVAVGFGLAALVGIAVCAAVGQSIWLMRGFDPLSRRARLPQPAFVDAD